MTPHPRTIAGFNVNATERWLLRWNEQANEVEFGFLESFSEEFWSWKGPSIGIPVAALRDLGGRLTSSAIGAPMPLPHGRELLVVPRVAPDGVTLLFTEGGALVHAANFSVGGRKRLALAIEQARAAARDPSLLSDHILRLEGPR